MSLGQDALPLEMPTWQMPYWVNTLGYMSSNQVFKLVKHRSPLIRQAQADGIGHVAPILVALGCTPAEAKKRVGKAVWRQVHHSPVELNARRANVLLRCPIELADLLRFPKGALGEVLSKRRQYGIEAVLHAGLIAKNRTEFREACMLARDTIRMGGTPDPKWSLRRLREEHDRRAMDAARGKADPTPWYDGWMAEVDGYTFTLINSCAMMAEEAAMQRHCVASYTESARSRRCLIMRITGHERATVRFGGKPIYAQDVRGRYNAAVSAKCKAACDKVAREYWR